MSRVLSHPAAKPLVAVLCLLPLAWIILATATDRLGANPAEKILRLTGAWTLRGLCLTLAVTPLRQWTGWNALARFRRMLGLFTFGYATLHLLAYAWLDQGLELSAIARDLGKRPFALVGFLAWLLMLPLALTSFNRAMRALGGARWQALHRAVYAVALLGLTHHFWMRAAKQRGGEVAIYALVIAVLLGWRLWRALRKRQAQHHETRPLTGA